MVGLLINSPTSSSDSGGAGLRRMCRFLRHKASGRAEGGRADFSGFLSSQGERMAMLVNWLGQFAPALKVLKSRDAH